MKTLATSRSRASRLRVSIGTKTVVALVAALHFVVPAHADSLDDLFNAAKMGDAKEVVQLVARGMDPNSSDPNGNTLLILAAREEQPRVVAELVKQRGIKLDARNAAGDSALMLASLRGNTEIVRQLVAAGASFDHAGWNPLLYAAFEGRLEVVEFLLEKGATPNALAPNGSTPLMYAARNGHEDVVIRLMKAGADLDLKNDQNETAESWAKRYNNTDIAELIQTERKARLQRGR